ncbi:MAG: LCP family protein [Candidatus Gastranaerophilales bacterium]|nr:LCP family protein [Candidatus Gastranaerophilales bacterium]
MATKSNQKNNPNAGGKRKMSAQERDARRRRKFVIFGMEIAVILAMVVVLYMVMSKEDLEGPTVTYIEPEKVAIPEEVKKESEEGTMQGYMNIALFGVDARTENQIYKGSRSDSTMIASVNLDTGEIRLVSVYRDTYLNLGNDKYDKCNAAYSNGGAEQAVKMLNMNLDMNITDFVTVGYQGLSSVIDGLGGVWIDVDETELKHINNYQIDVAKVLECDYTPVTQTGYQLLNGLQATAYCRIRYGGGDDFKRTSRQREVLKAIQDQAKQASYDDLVKAFTNSLKHIYTSLDEEDILALLEHIADYSIVEEDGFPTESLRTTANVGAVGSCVIPLDLEENVVWLHEFLFDDTSYQVTETVQEIGDKVEADTSPYIKRLN